MTGLQDQIGRRLIAKHFPNAAAEVVDWHAVWLSPPLVTALPPVHFVNDDDGTARDIEDFRRALLAAWQAYSRIPLHVRKGSGIDWVAFVRLVECVTGSTLMPREGYSRHDAVATMKGNLRYSQPLSKQARTAERPAKVALVEKARDAWRDLAGSEAPHKPSEGSPFLDFLSDVIEAAGKSWGAERTLSAWRTATRETEA